ncbi:MAG TPA: transposase [Nitrospinota bacterium]|jgi:REP element-mobilizing transposase RayT|nr:transposase [Nitrospinota bacterium]|tara:strand:- start:60 stop:1022 length:963 start_codon:yes stop_codon:yes gene_type:complete
MARQWRIEFEGAFYHILSRGNERKNIFKNSEDRILFLDTLGGMAERYDVEVYAYVLMSNHYHLVLKTNRANISQAMQWFGLTFTRKYNIKHHRSGHLFQGRFKAFLVENDEYLLHLSCYIHRNPLRARIVKRLIDYKWSSYPIYVYKKSHPKWLQTNAILSQLNVKNPQKAYKEIVQNYSKEEKKLWEEFRHGLILGSQEYVDKIKTKYLSENPNIEIPQKRKILGSDPHAILNKAASFLKCNMADVLSSKRVKPSNKEKRGLLIYLLWDMGLYNNKEIGELFNLGYSSISRRVSDMRLLLLQNNKLKKKFNRIKSLIKI